MNILVINAGSSSLKYQLFDMKNNVVMAKGLFERIGIDGHVKHAPSSGSPYETDVDLPDHAAAVRTLMELLTSTEHGVIKSMSEISAVGHRVVNGGEEFSASVLITPKVLEAVERCVPLAPLHNPANLTGIRACADVMDGIPQVAVFDTSFHQTMPAKAYMYALPYEYYTNDRVRRYGFHGTSYRFVAPRAAQMLGKPLEELKIVICHLGNGSSLAAIKNGQSFDTTMGMTPLEGLPMGTRSGSIDPGIIEFICHRHGFSAAEATNVLNKKSGMLGVSGVSSDFRDLHAAADKGNERAELALDIFAYTVKKNIGALAAAMGGIDALVFTAGVGENNGVMRTMICEDMEFIGISVDPELNAKRGGEMDISPASGKTRVLVIPTNEELVIAGDTKALVE